jgi:hypothetical protein
MGRTACTEAQCLYSTAIPLLPRWAVWPVQSLSACTVELYLYSPYGPYGLFRASLPVEGWALPLPYLIIKTRILDCKTQISITRKQDILYYYICLIMSHIARVGPKTAYNVETRGFIQHKNLVVSTIFYVTISPCTLFRSCSAIQASDFSMVSR